MDALQRLGFPVFSSGIALRGATKASPGTAGLPCAVAGVPVAQSDWVIADADGVVVVPLLRLDEIRAAAGARTEAEAGYFAALRGGATTVELLGLDPSLIKTTE